MCNIHSPDTELACDWRLLVPGQYHSYTKPRKGGGSFWCRVHFIRRWQTFRILSHFCVLFEVLSKQELLKIQLFTQTVSFVSWVVFYYIKMTYWWGPWDGKSLKVTVGRKHKVQLQLYRTFNTGLGEGYWVD